MKTDRNEATNSEVFLWALHKLGGSDRFVDVEDVFVEAFKLAPNRLSWRTRRDLPDLKKCSKGLRDADAKEPPLLVKTADGNQRRFTIDGIKWIQQNSNRMTSILEAGQVVREPRSRPRARMLSEVERSDVYATWRTTGSIEMKKWQLAELLRCSPDSDEQLWRERLEILRSSAYQAGVEEVMKFIEAIEVRYHSWFQGSLA